MGSAVLYIASCIYYFTIQNYRLTFSYLHIIPLQAELKREESVDLLLLNPVEEQCT